MKAKVEQPALKKNKESDKKVKNPKFLYVKFIFNKKDRLQKRKPALLMKDIQQITNPLHTYVLHRKPVHH